MPEWGAGSYICIIFSTVVSDVRQGLYRRVHFFLFNEDVTKDSFPSFRCNFLLLMKGPKLSSFNTRSWWWITLNENVLEYYSFLNQLQRQSFVIAYRSIIFFHFPSHISSIFNTCKCFNFIALCKLVLTFDAVCSNLI